MPARVRIRLAALPLLVALLLVPAGVAHADAAYDEVSAAYAQAGGQLDPCQFPPSTLQAALAGIPPEVAKYVPDVRKAIRDAIAAQKRGACKGRAPGTSTTPGSAVPPVTSTPTTPAATTPAPAATTPAPAATTPAPAPATTPAPAQRSSGGSDATPWIVAGAAIGALLLLPLLLWGWARLRGWDPTWTARTRHAWGEAGYRTGTTWSEFTDWLRLGR